MESIKTESKRSYLIGELAIKAKCEGVKISFAELMKIFEDNGLEVSMLEVTRAITKAYHDWKEIDESIAEAITQTYYGKNGLIIIL